MAKLFGGTPTEWDNMVLKTERSGSVLQSSAWARVQEARGVPCVQVVDEAGNPSLWIALPIKSWIWVWYCPKGPVAMPEREELRAIGDLLQQTKHAGLLRIEPDALPRGIVAHQRRDISPRHTLLTSIDRIDDELLASFHEKTRYNIRLAERHGVVVQKLSAEEVGRYMPEIMGLYHGTSSRHGIASSPRADLEALCRVGDVWIALHEGEIVATSIQMGFGSIMTYLHGASLYEKRQLMAPYALQWAVMRDARERGFATYDWWGVAPEGDEQHKLAGVTRFKLGFGGVRAEAPGTFDIGIDRLRFALYTLATKLRRP